MVFIEYYLLFEFFLDEVYCDNYILVINKLSGLFFVFGNCFEYFDSVMICV